MSELQKNSKIFFSSSLSQTLLEKTVFRTIEGEKQEKASLWQKILKIENNGQSILRRKQFLSLASFLASLHLCQQPLCWPLFMNQKLLLPLQIEWLTRVFLLGSCFSNSLCLAPLFSQLDLKLLQLNFMFLVKKNSRTF